jgi:MoxR-like ATPase
VRLGASPRAAIWLIRCAQAHALLASRDFVAPDDVKAMAVGCLAHRLVLAEDGHGLDAAARVVRSLLEATPTPRP